MSEHNLPEFYQADDGSRVSTPVYELLADCFFGKPGGPPALWEAGTELQTDLIPNEHMKPLNRAAGERVEKWLQSLPIVAGKLDEQDLAEAASLLAPREGESMPPHPIWWAGVIKLAGELKLKRTGSRIPNPVREVTYAKGKTPPPLSAGNFKDVSHRDQEATGMKAHPQIAGKRVKRGSPLMSAEPRQPAGDAT